MKRLSAILLVGALVFGTVGCTNMNKTQQGLLSGAAGVRSSVLALVPSPAEAGRPARSSAVASAFAGGIYGIANR
ncbi:MAG: cell envelope biogenesis protein OmpA [Bilophila wadsworthia]